MAVPHSVHTHSRSARHPGQCFVITLLTVPWGADETGQARRHATIAA
jgi:hypothetical protein